jgi:hypothetical protein
MGEGKKALEDHRMKPLFLDIDGVLNAHEPHPGSLYNGIRPDCMGRLNRVLKATGASLVISSAWRITAARPPSPPGPSSMTTR